MLRLFISLKRKVAYLTMAILNKKNRLVQYLFVILLMVSIAACGGGGASDPASNNEGGTDNGDGTTPPTPIDEHYIAIKAGVGNILPVRVGELVQLDGASHSSTSSSSALTYAWSFLSRPAESQAILIDPLSATPSFIADIEGDYRVQLVVGVEGISSDRAVSYVVATQPSNRKPTGSFNHYPTFPSDCAQCHLKNFNPEAMQSPNHPATSHMCETCHSVMGFSIITFVDHEEVFGQCSDCHNGTAAVGKSAFHEVTTLECNECHNTQSFIELESDGSYDHNKLTNATCSRCHNGQTAIGKDEDHVVTETQCGYCHSTESFMPAFVDHSDFKANCSNCHNDTDASGKASAVPIHVVTTLECDVCHSIDTFDLGGIFDHAVIDSVSQPCASCHNDVNAAGLANTTNHPYVAGVDCAFCHNTTDFADAFVDHSGPAVVGKRCDSCHGDTAVGMPFNHLPVTSEDCTVCHTPGTFSSGVFDHSSRDVNRCDACHNGVITVGKIDHHLPTEQQCSVCHTTSSFTDATFNHSSITISCESCHDGQISKGKSGNHLPTSRDCIDCHSSGFSSFAGASFDHVGIDSNNCSLCHDGNIALGKTGNHIPIAEDCSVCHTSTNTGGFASSSFLAAYHIDISKGCEGCHNSRYATGKPTTDDPVPHLPTTQDCNICHANSAFKPVVNFNHSGITGNCVSCHDGDHSASGAIGKSVNHVPTEQDCGICHNTTNEAFTPALIDHSGTDVVGKRCDSCHDGAIATGKASANNHVTTSEDCQVCHVVGTFANAYFGHDGVVNNCASCHDGLAASGMSDNHMPVSEDCSNCHNTSAFSGAKYDHTGIVGDCVACHNGSITAGKHAEHLPTSQDCSVCHYTSGFKPANFTHAGIVDKCSFCHNDVFALGKPTDHAPTNQDCVVCHTTTSFLGAGYNHTGIVDDCASCHNGDIAPGRSPNHMSTTLDCHFCHSTATFLGGNFDHQGITSDCQSCHDGARAEDKPPTGHLPTTEDCSVCHTTGTFATGTFSHSSNYLSQYTCSSCHNDEISIGKPELHLPTEQDCGSCHNTTQFKNAFVDHSDPAVTSVRCGSCHNGYNATGKPSPSQGHLATAEDCVVCHTPGSFTTGVFNHAQLYLEQNTCAACHNGVISLAKPGNHVSTMQDCGSCHNTQGFKDAVIDHTDPEVTSRTCHSCHDDSTARGKSVTHPGTSDLCEACHTPEGFKLIDIVDHNEVFGTCSSCHNNIVAIGKSEFHTQTNAECDECHNTDHFLNLNPDGSFDHEGIVRQCAGCHNGSIAMGPDNTNYTHAPDAECGSCHNTTSFVGAYPDHTAPIVTESRCDSCHGVTASGTIVGHPDINPLLDCRDCHSIVSFSMDGFFDHRLVDPGVQTCESCHNSSTSINAPAKPTSNHVVTTSDCGSCHTTDLFTPAYVDHNSTEVTNRTCVSCHDGSTNGATGMSSIHLPTTEDCDACHSPGDFNTGTFNHADSYLNAMTCSVCHDDVITKGKGPNHLPTTADCGVCHDTTAFVPTPFNHEGIDTNNCELCHDGGISTGKPDNHVPTDEDCSSCHNITNFNSFAGILYNHIGIDPNNCSACHGNSISMDKPVNHIPALGECSVCHDSTDTFTSTIFRSAVHDSLTSGCEGCHIDQFLPAVSQVKSASHLPTSQDCYICHTVSSFTQSTFSHKGITDNCESCHDGIDDHVAAGAIGAPPTVVHSNTNEDCSACHNIDSFSDAFLDHSKPPVVGNRCDSCHNGTDATGMDAKTDTPHIPTTDDCVLCHKAGATFAEAVFNHQGIVDNCASCHDGSYATGMSSEHVAIAPTQDCSDCHNTEDFSGAKFDHNGIEDNCSSCHDGVTAPGKTPPPGHVPTNQDCSFCHQTTGFTPATFAHVGIQDNCSSCHDAGFATGKPAGHVSTSQDCGSCHNTGSFVGATVDHSSPAVQNARCDSCHDGNTVGAKSKQDADPPHVDTNQDCNVCHKSTATFSGASWVHDASTAGNCTSCHADDMNSGHLGTTEECDVCHSTNAWSPSTFVHPLSIPGLGGSGPYNPLDHRRALSCTACHGNTITATIPDSEWSNTSYKPYCAGCHDRDYDTGERRHRGIATDKDCYGSCHEHSISSSGF